MVMVLYEMIYIWSVCYTHVIRYENMSSMYVVAGIRAMALIS